MMRAMKAAQSGVHHSSPAAFERRGSEMRFAKDFVFEFGTVIFSLMLFAFSAALAFYFCFCHKALHETHPGSLVDGGCTSFQLSADFSPLVPPHQS